MNINNNWKRVVPERANLRGEYISIRSVGFTFSAALIKKYNLQNKKAVAILKGDDPFLFGFELLDEIEKGSYTLRGSSGDNSTATRTIHCGSIINQSKLLTRISSLPTKDEKSFKAELHDDILIIRLAPCFEQLIAFSDIKDLNKDKSGIYRCLDSQDTIVYIGSGKIKERAITRQKETGTHFNYIEYSEIPDRDQAMYWERYYHQEFKNKFGELPLYNRILAPKTDLALVEGELG